VRLYPAIDIRGGRCVRLVEGDFNRETEYAADPADAAQRWAEAGAEWLHIVDLDGAVAGQPVNQEAIARVRQRVAIPMQLGGGLREIAHLETVFGRGIDRAILGTAALRSPELVREAVARWGDAIAVALDARDGRLATDGWLGQSDARAIDVARQLTDVGVRTFIFTDISRDGTLSGPNLESLAELVATVDAAVIASGGVAAIDDLRAAATAGAAGAIVGRALYDGRIDLAEAIAAIAPLESAP
jgi:phosphoribosylformimino-5-aminoimidazole carboxamide ribotide isomerase